MRRVYVFVLASFRPVQSSDDSISPRSVLCLPRPVKSRLVEYRACRVPWTSQSRPVEYRAYRVPFKLSRAIP